MQNWRSLAAVGISLFMLAGYGQGQTPSARKVDRAVVATRLDDSSVYVGWRFLPTDALAGGFNVYRQGPDGAQALVNDNPITDSTNLVDAKAGAGKISYVVEALADRVKSRAAMAGEQGANYVSIPMHSNEIPRKVAVADLDGDGRLDYVVRLQPGHSFDPNHREKSTDTYKLEAYNADGKFLWRYDMGWAIEESMWCAPYVAYDCDGDGKAEVYTKAGDDIPQPKGMVLTGAEYIVKLDGMTGKVVAKAPWPDRSGWEKDIEKNTPKHDVRYNFISRNEMAIACLDGKHPSVVVIRGTYSLIKVNAYDGQLKQQWAWRSDSETRRYTRQGAHTLRVADVDGDGRDEVLFGAACVDHDGKGLWTLGLGHPDAVYSTDFDPTNPGMEVLLAFEDKQTRNGICVVDARTGKILRGWKKPTTHVEGEGMFGYVTDLLPGPQFSSFEAHRTGVPPMNYGFACLSGEELDPEGLCGDSGTPLWWDADDYKEILSAAPNPDPTDHHRQLIGELGIHKFKGQPMQFIPGSNLMIADVLGDWREEIIINTKGGQGQKPGLRIYTTDIPATTRRPWLMSDHHYEMDVAGIPAGSYYPAQLAVMPAPQGPPHASPKTAISSTAKAATQPARKAPAKAPTKVTR